MSGLVSALYPPINVLPGTYSTLIEQGQPGGLPVPTMAMVLAGTYARVSDLFATTNATDLLLAYAFNGTPVWKPVRNEGYSSFTIAGGSNLILTPLRSAPTVRVLGTVSGVAATIAPSIVGAWPGLEYDIRFDGILQLVGLTLLGVSGGNIPLVAASNKKIVFNGTTWENK